MAQVRQVSPVMVSATRMSSNGSQPQGDVGAVLAGVKHRGCANVRTSLGSPADSQHPRVQERGDTINSCGWWALTTAWGASTD